MDGDAKIMANMKEVLKKTRKNKGKKSHKAEPSKASEPVNDESISEILMKNWKFSSPPDSASPTVNAFERLMSKKPEPLGETEVNGVKKRKYVRKLKLNKDDGDNQSLLDEKTTQGKTKSPTTGIMKFLELPKTPEVAAEPKVSVEDVGTKKRSRTVEEIAEISKDVDLKPRKARKTRLILDSNENSIEQNGETGQSDDHQLDTPKYSSGRPRRSCAANINYESLISPDKTATATKIASPPRKVRKVNKKEEDFPEILVDDDTDSKPIKKLAPLFMKKIPKPAVDPAVKEARRNFLLSNLPAEIRTSIDKQKRFEDEILNNELVSFPSTSHVTQLSLEAEDHIFAQDLKTSRVIIKNDDEAEEEAVSRQLNYGTLTDCRASDAVVRENGAMGLKTQRNEPLDNVYLKARVKELKETFGNFPTNRCFRQLYWMFKNAGISEIDSGNFSDSDSIVKSEENLMFVDIFKPTSIKHFVVNVEPIKELQKFLLTWNDKTDGYDSDDSNSRASSKSSNNFVVLSGPNGCGKTVSVYALAKELNYHVIEINAGQRRSGKKLLDSLLEATQSHRVKDKTGKMFANEEEASLRESGGDVAGAKSIILIEDAELAFESDDGFVSSIQQLINISKRPV